MNQTERERVHKDIVNHWIEEIEVGAGDSIHNDQYQDVAKFEEELEMLSSEELEARWFSTVGEWVSAMQRWGRDEFHTDDGTPLWEAEGYDSIAEWQFDKLVSTGDVDYGYQAYRYEQPY